MRLMIILRPVLDLTMLICMLLALAFQLTGNAWHEIIGILMLVAFILHNLINYKWYKGLVKGKYSTIRIIHLLVNWLLLIDMLVLMVTGIMSAQVLFQFLPRSEEIFKLRQIHTASAYWGLILISIHLGNHWQLIFHKILKLTAYPTKYCWVLHLMAIGISGYGVIASFQLHLGARLISYYTFTYWNFSNSTLLFFANYLAIMGLYINLTNLVLQLIIKSKGNVESS